MRIRTTLHAALACLRSFLMLAAAASGAAAQSGRVVPTPTPAPAAAEPEAAPAFVPDPNRDRYRLIFPTDYERKFVPHKKGERLDYDATRHSLFENFVAHINRACEQGYRLLSVYDEDLAVVERSDARYEYAWFETTGSYFFFKNGFESSFSRLSKAGFRLVYHSLIYSHCEPIDPENSAYGETCVFKDFYLAERAKGDERPREYEMAFGHPRWRVGRIAPAMTEAVKEKIGQGFYPAALLSPYEVLLERLPAGDARLSPRRDVQVVRAASFWGSDNLPKKVGELAQQGYRLELADHQIAVMYREEGDAAPVSYVWLDAGGKEGRLEKELAALAAGGAVFRTAYPDGYGVERTLVFERGASAGGRRREYTALTLEREETNRTPGKGPPARVARFDLTPPSKEAWAELHRLVGEGFVVRALFRAGRPRVLLERTR